MGGCKLASSTVFTCCSCYLQFILKTRMGVCEKVDIVAIKERFNGSQDGAKSAFEELVIYVCQLEAALCEKKELAKTKIMALKESNCQQREKLERLRRKYLALIQLYNKFAEDCEKPENLKEASDSSY